MIFALLPYALQLALIIHIIKTNKPFYWLYLIIFIPYLGGIAYLLIEILPALLNSRQLRQTGSSILYKLNPSANIKKLQEQLENQDTISNRTALAQAYIEVEDYAKAEPLLSSCLTGPFADDRFTLVLFARTLFGSGKIKEACELLQKLQKIQRFSSPEEKLLDVRVRSALCEQPLLNEFETLWNESKNFETGFYYVQAAVQSGNTEKAGQTVREMQRIVKTYKNFSRSIGTEWLRKAKALL